MAPSNTNPTVCQHRRYGHGVAKLRTAREATRLQIQQDSARLFEEARDLTRITELDRTR